MHQTIQDQAALLSSIDSPGIKQVKTALLFSGGLESTHVKRYLSENTSGLQWEPFRISMLLDTREYGIILPAVIQARYEGYKQVIISDDHTADAPFYTEAGAELLLTARGRLAASQVLGINVIANEDYGFVFDKWEAVPSDMSDIVSCFEQEYEYKEEISSMPQMCSKCKKCFAIYTLQVAKYGISNVALDKRTWLRYLMDAHQGMKSRVFNYGVEIFHLVHKHDGWKNLQAKLPGLLQYDLISLKQYYKDYQEKTAWMGK